MLEIRNVSKIYRSKTGEEVKALDNVSISFPETGMVFILGKSGSGKSTLLNVMGGLDSYDKGEFIIKGKSSKDFVGSDFDAYRNTFIGFIFQEYNVLDDFTVAANIGLALELQGKKATDEAISGILQQVDLLNYAKRKPNELSGGQKQRVAIARALVKDPQIIMADEPTGALDSNTGKQIFDALKQLSKQKLVLVVSHDRDFAEKYADRIVELADGKIIEDVTKHQHESEKISDGVHRINHQLLRIEKGYMLTARDLDMINEYLANAGEDVLLSGDGRVNEEVRSAAGISKDGTAAVFETTNQGEDVKIRPYEKEESRFIRSRLPMKNAVKMGSSGLKHKKFRLFMTILLSFVSFAMFGLADTMAAYDKIEAATESIVRADIVAASVTLGVRTEYWYDGEMTNVYYGTDAMNDEDIQNLNAQSGLQFTPVFTGSAYSGDGGFSIANMYSGSVGDSAIYQGKIQGLISMEESKLGGAGLSMMSGHLPTASGEIAITDLLLDSFNEYGFKNNSKHEEIKAGEVTVDKLIGKHLTLNKNGMEMSFTIVGVVETHFNENGRYDAFLPSDEPEMGGNGGTEEMTNFVLGMELENLLQYSFHALSFAYSADIQHLSQTMAHQIKEIGTYMQGINGSVYLVYEQPDASGSEDGGKGDINSMYSYNMVAGNDSLSGITIHWLAEAKTSLADNEVVVPSSLFEALMPREVDITISAEEVGAYVTELKNVAGSIYSGNWEDTNADQTFRSRWEEMAGYAPRARWDMLNFLIEKGYVPAENSIYNDALAGDSVYQTGISNYLNTVIENTLGQMTAAENTVSLSADYVISLVRDMSFSADYLRLEVCKKDNFRNFLIEYWGVDADHYDGLTETDRKEQYISAFAPFVESEYANGIEVTYTGDECKQKVWTALGIDMSNLTLDLKMKQMDYSLETSTDMNSYTLKVVGYYDENNMSSVIFNQKILTDYEIWYAEAAEAEGFSTYKETPHNSGIWAFAVAPMGTEPDVIRKLVEMSYDDTVGLRFEMQNAVMSTLSMFNDMIEIMAQVFMWVGLGLALFSAFLLMNFIATSISYKKREIGILRAVGARSSDVFKIFFSEAFIIAMINFVLAIAATVTTVFCLNNWMETQGINVQLLTFGIRQVGLMLGVSILVAALSSFLPVYKIARKKPVDAIKDR